MNENSEGTQNPLSAGHVTNPPQAPNSNQPVGNTPVAPVGTPAASAEAPVVPNTTGTPVPPTTGAPTTNHNVTVESLDPTGRPMEQAAVATEEPPKKKKTGLIVGIIVGLLVMIGGVVAAVMLMGMQSGDAVMAAMQKLMSDNAPKNIAIDGTVDILLNDEDSMFKRVNINLDSDIVIGSMINTSSAVLTLTDQKDNDYSVKFRELYAANGDLFFEVEGATAALEDSGLIDVLVSGGSQPVDCTSTDGAGCTATDAAKNCAEGENCTAISSETTATKTMVDSIVGVVESIDGTWLRISTDELAAVGLGSLGQNSVTSCVTNLVSDINKNSNSAIGLYRMHPFVVSTDKNITVQSRQNPIYRVSLDSQNFVDFINAIQNTEISKNLYRCLGMEDNLGITKQDIDEAFAAVPAIYVEVNNENNFTRLYMESTLGEDPGCASNCPEPTASVIIDLGFSYPTNVNVTEPVEYTDYSVLLQKLFSTMYGIDVTTNSATVVEVSN